VSSEIAPARDPWASAQSAAQAAMTPQPGRGKRVRVVLAERRRTRRVVRTLAEVEKQTSEGEELLLRLVRDQLSLAIRLGGLTVVVLGSLPLAFALVPSLGGVDVLGLRLPWLLLGVAVYPFLLAVAWSYNRNAEHYEQEFAEMVES
jgi:Flp pilus assembly protein TadB